MNFIRGMKEEINSLIDQSFTSKFLIMGDFNCIIRERETDRQTSAEAPPIRCK